MKKLKTPIGDRVGHYPWPPEGTLIQLRNNVFSPGATFILGVVHADGTTQGICLRGWDDHWRQEWVFSGSLIQSSEAYILEEGDEFYDEASRRYMSLLLIGAAK